MHYQDDESMCLQNVADHEEFQHMDTGASRISEDRHFSGSARRTEGLTCASDHGTHVASLAAGFQTGAGKSSNVVSGKDNYCPDA